MRNYLGLNDFFGRNRKPLYFVLSLLMILILTLTVVYAALSTTLNINGNAEVTAASWDVYLDNVQLNSQSVTTNVPTITDKTTASFSTTLTKPGDFYEFTIDVVNNGSIDAMIESVTKTPVLTDTQKKYLNYIVEYQNGETITSKQLVKKKSFVRLKVKVEFRKDILASDLPTQSETLNLSFKVNYVQSDDSGINVENDGIYDLYMVGNEICYEEECFYVISSDEDSVTMLAKYNLYVGNECTSITSCVPYGEEATGKQNPAMIGRPLDLSYPRQGTTIFGTSNVYSGSIVEKYVDEYSAYLSTLGVVVEDARLIEYEELESLGCSGTNYSCFNAPEWLYSTTYWTGTASGSSLVWIILGGGPLYERSYTLEDFFGVRPVIKIAKS